jgi:hypothetical protein
MSNEEYSYSYETFLKYIGSDEFDYDCTNWVLIIGQFTESIVKL